MKKLRVSIVQYLNTAPLVRGFTHGALQGKYDLSFTVPSQCAEELRTNAADIAIIPAIEYQRIDNLTLLPDLSIAAKRRVRSLLLISKGPIQQARSIALDASSRSTQALVRILCAERWRISPEFRQAQPDLPAMLRDADAALLIGDPALRFSIGIENDSRRAPDGEQICSAGEVGVDARVDLHVYDIVEEWRALTNLPAVLAVWAVRQDALSPAALPDVASDFQSSLAFGLRQIPEICAEASQQLQLPEPDLRTYLDENIDYSLDDQNLQGLLAFFQRAAALHLIPALTPISICGQRDPIAARASNL